MKLSDLQAADTAPAPDDPQAIYARNKAWAKPEQSYITALPPDQEQKFQDWVKQNKVPFDPSPTADYDMRGFWRGLQSGDPNAKTGVNQNDGKLHFSDYWKTPYHKSFSAESQWADPAKAPKWNDQDQLVTPDGKVVFDERAKPAAAQKMKLSDLGPPPKLGEDGEPPAHFGSLDAFLSGTPSSPGKDATVQNSNDPEKVYGDILPLARSKKTGQLELAMPKFLRQPVQSADTLQQSTEGKRYMSPEQQQMAGLDVVSMIAGGGPGAGTSARLKDAGRDTLRSTPEMVEALGRKTGEAVKPKPVPTVEGLGAKVDNAGDRGSSFYQEATAKGGVLSNTFANKFIDDWHPRLNVSDNEKSFASKINVAELKAKPTLTKAEQADLDRAEEMTIRGDLRQRLEALRGQPLTLDGVQGIDEHLSSIIENNTEPNGHVKKAGVWAQKVQADLRNRVKAAGPQDVHGGNTEGFEALKNGRAAWAQAMKMRDVQRVVDRAATSDTPAAALRTGLRQLRNNGYKLRGWEPDEIKALNQAITKGKTQELMASVGKKWAIGAGGTAGAAMGSVAGPLGIGAGTLGGAYLGMKAGEMGQAGMLKGQMRKVGSLYDLLDKNAPQRGEGAAATAPANPLQQYMAGASLPPSLGSGVPRGGGPAGRGPALPGGAARPLPPDRSPRFSGGAAVPPGPGYSGPTGPAGRGPAMQGGGARPLPPDMSPRFTGGASVPPGTGYQGPTGPAGRGAAPQPNGGAGVTALPPQPIPAPVQEFIADIAREAGSTGIGPASGPGGPAMVPLPNGGALVVVPPPRRMTPPPPGLGGAGDGASGLQFLPVGGGSVVP